MKVSEIKNNNKNSTASFEIKYRNDKADFVFSGSWVKENSLPDIKDSFKKIDTSAIKAISANASSLESWDSIILTSLLKIREFCAANSIKFDQSALPEGIRRLIALASAVPERKGVHKEEADESFLTMTGNNVLRLMEASGELFEFIGNAIYTFYRLIRKRAKFRKRDLFLFMQECGAQALPIVSLISVLFGLILAFVGAVQLKMFGAEIFVANLVSIGMAREMGAIMTGIIMTGRTGSSFAAQLGTMQVNEEISALETLGISPMEFLVLPRMLALIIMMPILCIYADIVGIIGGGIVGIGMLKLSFMEYFNQTCASIDFMDFAIGLIKSSVFGVLIALSGCLRGMQCGRSASDVGRAATSAVVMGIVAIVIADSVITVLCSILGI